MRVRVLGFRSDPNPTLTLILTLTVVKDPRTIAEADFAEAQSVSFFEARLFLKGTYEAPVQLTPTPTLTPTLALTPTRSRSSSTAASSTRSAWLWLGLGLAKRPGWLTS